MNNFQGIGYVATDAVVRNYGPENRQLVSFNVACNDSKNPDAPAQFIQCTYFNRGESFAKHVTKGVKVFFSGPLRVTQNEGYVNVTVAIREFEFCGNPHANQGAAEANQNSANINGDTTSAQLAANMQGAPENMIDNYDSQVPYSAYEDLV